jgi:HD-GYP domain-containing protein (c-di-GMP phosphodiesterase class II)
MTSARAYRPAMGYAEALGELRRAAGSQLDPDVVAVLLRLLEPSDGDPAPAAEPASEA